MSNPIKVLVTGAAGQIAYSLLYNVAKGNIFGPDTPISLVLLDIEPMMQVLDGVVMELKDCALPLLKEIQSTAALDVGFKEIDVAILVGAMPRREGMERKDLLASNVKIFKSQGQALDKYAKKTVKVVVVGNPANTNALICMKYAPSIPQINFSALTRLDQNRAQYQIASKCGVSSQDVHNVVIWGNHSSTQFPDVSHATVMLPAGKKTVKEAVQDDKFLKNDFLKCVQNRGAAIIKARKLSSAMSAAKAICDHVHDWWFGVQQDTYVSMAVCSDGSYNIEKGLIFSFPVTTKPDHSYEIVQGLSIDDFSRSKLDITLKELLEERDLALSVCE